MWGKTVTAYAHAYIENQPKRDLLTMTEADREAFIQQVKDILGQRVRKAKIYREAHELYARTPPQSLMSVLAEEIADYVE